MYRDLDLVAAVHDGLTTKLEEDSWDGSRLHVSDLGCTIPGEKCPREVWLRIRGTPDRPETLGSMMRFDHGHRIHERLTEIINRGLTGGWEIHHVEGRVSLAEGKITGSFDLMISHPDGRRVIPDYKTKRGRAFAYMSEASPSNVMQVRAYLMATDADCGILFYVDREGENEPVQFWVERDDEVVRRAVEALIEMAEAEEPPPILPVRINIKENKGPDSVYVDEPWQCSYCRKKGASCMGALANAGLTESDTGLVGHLMPDGTFRAKPGYEHLAEMVEDFIASMSMEVAA